LHYYTLIRAGWRVRGCVDPPAARRCRSSCCPVSIPAQVDQPQLVVREGGQGVALLNGERWIAPLGDEVRGALSADLARALHSQDVSGLPANDKPMLRIKLDLRRFRLAARQLCADRRHLERACIAWRAEAGAVACSSRVSESVGPGYDALVQGHQRAIGSWRADRRAAVRWQRAGGDVPGQINRFGLGARPALG
jgi:uncharacterized lipoprotein YmbA